MIQGLRGGGGKSAWGVGFVKASGPATAFAPAVAPAPGAIVRFRSGRTYGPALHGGAFRLLVDKTLAALYRGGKIKAILGKSLGREPLDRKFEAMFLNSLPER